MALPIDASAPGWAKRLAQDIDAELESLRNRRGPVRLPRYGKADLPPPASFPQCFIWVTDDAGGATPAFSDGAAWRRTGDRNVIS